MPKNEGGRAFARPLTISDYMGPDPSQTGMSMRQYYKAHPTPVPDWWILKNKANLEKDYPKMGDLKPCEGCKNGCDCEETEECKKRDEVFEKQAKFESEHRIKVEVRWAAAYADLMIAEDMEAEK